MSTKTKAPPGVRIEGCNFTTTPFKLDDSTARAVAQVAEAALENARAIGMLASMLKGPESVTSIAIGRGE